MLVDLMQLSLQGESGFALYLSDDSILLIETVVRRVPNSRIVCKGQWNGREVYAKLFIGASASRHAQRDANGIQQLLANHIATPDLLFQGQSNEGAEVLIYQAIEDSQNAEEALKVLPIGSPARFEVLKNIVIAVAGHHSAGLVQTDLYFKNFLIQQEQVWTLDGDGIQTMSSLFKQHQQTVNLATLFSKMDALDDTLIEALYEAYCQRLGRAFLVMDVADVWQKTQKIRHRVAASYAFKKVFRNCTDVKMKQSFKHLIAVASNFNVDSNTLLNLDEGFKNGAVLKNGRTCTVARFNVANLDIVIKRYNIKNLWHGIGRLLRQSRAAKSWGNAHYLIISAIPTPQPLALIESRFGILRRSAYFLSAYVEAPDVADFFQSTADTELKQRVAYEIARLFYKLSLLKIAHGDCKASNIKIVNAQPMLLDLDAMTTDSLFYEHQHIRDLKRLFKNWAHDAETTAMLKQAFINVYDENDPFSPSVLRSAGIDV